MRPRVLMFALALAACAGSIPVPTDESARKSGTSRVDLERGRELYVNRCSSCHALFQPGRFPPEKWNQMVGEMSRRAKLDGRESEVVLRYLVSYARPGT